MSITPEQIIMATDAKLDSFSPMPFGSQVVFNVAADDIEPLKRYLATHGGHSLLQLIVLAEDGEPATPAPAARYEAEAQALRESGWLARTDVLATLGTDDAYHQWVTYQPSIVSGQFNETDDAGEPRNVACHVRRAGEGGTGHKPAFASVPMTNDEHHRQHNHGETAVHIRWQRLQGIAPLSLDRDDAQRWFDQRLAWHRTQWAERELCAYLRAERLGDIQPLAIVRWAQENALPVPDAFDAGVEVSA